MTKGIVTSATILANGPCVNGALEEGKKFPSCSFGVHLNLTEFRPLSKNEALKELLTDEGSFSGILEMAPQRVKKTKALWCAIADEWCHQIEFVMRAGIRISHLDSHHHVHTIPFVFPVLKLIQRKYGIKKVRLARNVYGREERPSPFKLWAKGVYNVSLRHFYATYTTCVFLDFLTFYERVIVEGERWPIVEVMVHPGSSTERDEYRLLTSNWIDRVGGKMQLINYHEL
jgi:predicted glycoside hydrolase/deacetylase ChbG (UPF0249 family)